MKVTDIRPASFKNFFSNEEYSYIYNVINKTFDFNKTNNKSKFEGFRIHENGFAVIPFEEKYEENKNFFDGLNKKLSELLNLNIFNANGFFARYTTENGYEPQLRPHIDGNNMEIGRSLSLTVQLDSTLSWPIYVVDDLYSLEKNETVIFVGSRDVHFRPAKQFSKDDYCDIFVMHFFVKDAEPEYLPENYGDVRQNIQDLYEEKYKNILHMPWVKQ